MGGGSYSFSSRSVRTKAFKESSMDEIFKERSINNAMSPYGVKIRESRDSDEHPNSLAIIIALDLTGSMGSVPNHLVKDGLPNIMENIINGGEKDPQILFVGVGDHECDSAPLQIGQFESSDDLLDKWLTTVYLEGGGGGNAGESYLLAWYFAGYHTSIDCMEKRGRKGFLFTIGDEPTLKEIPKSSLKAIMGDGQYQTFSADDLLAKAAEKYEVYHLHIKETHSGSRESVMDGWKQLLGDRCIIVERHADVSNIISKIITGKKTNTQTSTPKKEEAEKEEEIL